MCVASGRHAGATAVDASIAGAMGLAAAAGFAIALPFSPRYGLVAKAVRARRGRRRMAAALR